MPKEIRFSHRHILTRLQAVAPGVIRVTRTRRDHFLTTHGPAAVCHGLMDAALCERGGETLFTAGHVTVRFPTGGGPMTFTDADGRVLLREHTRRPCDLQAVDVTLHSYEEAQITQGQSVDGARAWAAPSRTWVDRTAYEGCQRFLPDEDEGLYGLGSHEEGYGNLRGRSQLLYQHNMKAVVPVLVSTKGWGLLFDMGCLMAFQDDPAGFSLWVDCTDEMDWYFLYGDGSYPSLMERHRLLTGEAPMLPRYALGYIQSKERYVDAREMLDTAAEYRRRGVPLDMIVLDWQSWPEGQWGWKTFDRTRFPDPAALIDALHAMDVHFMISIWPSMQGENNADRHEMLQNGCMLGNRLIYNAFDPKARALYWKQANEGLFVHGVDGWWCDCTEPFESDWRGSVRSAPFRRAQLNTDEAKRYIDPTQIGLFSLLHAQGIYEGQRSVTADKRVCNLTRSSWAGQHRYATITWSGDVSASWDTLRRHIPEGLNFCAAGEPYWSTDIGAFFPQGSEDMWFCEGDYDQGMDDPAYRELFVRWAQFAVFLPMMRAHGTLTPREIWRLGDEGDPCYAALEKTIRLRYHLTAYLYSLMARVNRTGMPMLLAPALVFPQDKALRRVDDQLLLGDWLLAKPVTQPMNGASVPVSMLLPSGFDWYALDGSQRHAGGQTVTLEAALDTIPLLVRAGTILPWSAPAPSTAAQAGLPLEIRIYPGADGCFTLYNDAGDGYGYEQGQCAAITLRWNDAASLLTIGPREGSYPGMPGTSALLMRRMDGGKPLSIAYTGQEITLQLPHQEE